LIRDQARDVRGRFISWDRMRLRDAYPVPKAAEKIGQFENHLPLSSFIQMEWHCSRCLREALVYDDSLPHPVRADPPPSISEGRRDQRGSRCVLAKPAGFEKKLRGFATPFRR